MARRVSGGGMSAGVSVAALGLVIVIFLICLTVAYSFFIAKENVRHEGDAVKALVRERDAQVTKTLEMRQAVTKCTEKHEDKKGVIEFLTAQNLEQHELPAEDVTFKKLLDALDDSISRYQIVRDQLAQQSLSAKEVAHREAEGTVVDREAYRKLAEAKQAELAELERFLAAEVRRKEEAVNKYNEERTGFANEYSNTKDEHEIRKAKMLNEIATAEERTHVVRRELEFLSPVPPMRKADGKVLVSNWQTSQVVLNIGTDRGAFAGMVLSIYRINDVGQQEVKGRIQIMKLDDATSTCHVLEESKHYPIVDGDPVHVPFIAIPSKKRFVIVGVFGSEAAYNKAQLAGLIQLNGGIVQEKVDLFTDYIIQGETGAGVKEDADEAAKARHEMQVAKEMSVRVIDYLDFISYIRQ